MCWRCDNPDRPIEDYLDELWAIIGDHGWAVQFVEDEKRPFAYTIGLHDLGVPELVISGVSPGGATHVPAHRPGETIVTGLPTSDVDSTLLTVTLIFCVVGAVA
ncbi:DUF4262 domain-containing protein, partial [Mycolicibacterium pulveris]